MLTTLRLTAGVIVTILLAALVGGAGGAFIASAFIGAIHLLYAVPITLMSFCPGTVIGGMLAVIYVVMRMILDWRMFRWAVLGPSSAECVDVLGWAEGR